MKKACQYCGKIHEKSYICPRKPIRKPKKFSGNETRFEDAFRSSYIWKKKREYIKERDKYLCRVCYAGLPGTIKRLNTDELSVHHIVAISANPDLRLSDENLITLCAYHHEKAESGEISAEILRTLIPPYPDEPFF